jgi:hypothetical protein
MHALWTEDGSKAISEIAGRHGFSEDAGRAMAEALLASSGSMAQFHHPDLGGMGQWSRGGMLMIGDMFNNSLKARVAGLAEDLAEALGRGAIVARRPAYGESSSGYGKWWPEELGSPSSTGAQNDRRYAVFPDRRRLAIENDGRVSVYDTGDHRIGGASQQQGGGSTLSFSTDRGSVGIERFTELREARAPREEAAPQAEVFRQPEPAAPAEDRPAEPPQSLGSSPRPAEPAHRQPEPSPSAPPHAASGDPVELIRKLATLREAGLLTEDEFQAKKTELLARI